MSTKTLDDDDNSIYCDKCNLWVYIKCSNLNFLDYQYLNGNDDPWFCLKCNTELFPFGTLNNKTFNQYISSSNIRNRDIDQDNSSNFVLEPPPNLNSLFNQFNNSSQIHDFKDPENVVSCKHYNLEEVETMKIPNKKHSLSLFHINACTRITSYSKSIIDIFSNYISQEIISGNLASTISDHLPQFLIAPHIFSNAPNIKSNIFERDWSKFNCEEFILDCFAIDWPHILKLENNDTNTSFQNFFDSMNRILIH